jgi:HPt (histidine-containing phosphotransfer) domain-containing protein
MMDIHDDFHHHNKFRQILTTSFSCLMAELLQLARMQAQARTDWNICDNIKSKAHRIHGKAAGAPKFVLYESRIHVWKSNV